MPLIAQKELAERLALSTRQIRNLEDKRVLEPISEEGKKRYPWPESSRAYVDFKIREGLRRAETTAVDEWERRHETAAARMAEIKVEAAEGRLILLETHALVDAELADRLAAVILNIPSNFCLDLERAGLSPAEAQAVLEKLAADLMRGLRGVADDIADVPDDDLSD